jgi:TolB-like protein/Tfp pilus assembly protein PilF
MTEPAAKIFYEFREFRLDPQQRLLTAGADGQPIPLPPKVFDTLLYFVERRGELLDKATLLKAVWPNVIVEENSLNQNISVIRRALGESPGEHRFIVTEPGRGYRFVADVSVAATPQSNAVRAASDRPATAVAPTAATAEQRKSIAVLPFANLTGDPAKEYFSDGMSEELLHTLARIPGLKVPSRTSSFSYKGRNMDVRQIARDLDVGVVLEGSVRSAGERIRITAQLIDGHNGFHLWSQHYDRDFGDLFKLQDELAGAIVETLRMTLGGHGTGQSWHEPPTRDLEAYHLYLQAMAMQARVTDDTYALPKAFELLQRAIERDPGFARAYNAIAAFRAIALALDVPIPGTLADAERDVLRGIALDPTLGSPHAALGIIYSAQGKWLNAQERFHDAFACDDADPTSKQGYGLHLLGSLGFLRRFMEVSHEAHRLAPAWLATAMNLAVSHALLDQPEPAHQYIELAAGLGLPRNIPPMADVIAQLALREGRQDEAGEIMVAMLPPRLAADGGSETVRRLCAALRRQVKDGASADALDALRARASAAEMTQMMRRRFMVWYTGIGAIDQAFEVMNESLDLFARTGTIGTAWAFLWMREMLPFRTDRRFQTLCRRMGFFEYWRKYGPPDNAKLRGDVLDCQ